MAPTNLVHIVVGPGMGTWGRQSTKTIERMKNTTSQQVVCRKIHFLKKYKDQNDSIAKIYRFEKVVGLIFIEKSIKLKESGKTSVFITRP